MKNRIIAVFIAGALSAPLSASAQLAYASNEKDGTISVIDTAKDEVVASIKAGKTPRGMAASVDGKRLYVSDQKSNALRIIDLATRAEAGAIDLGESPEGVGRSPDGKWVVVAIEEDHQVFFVDVATGKIAFRVKVEGENPEHAVFSPDSKWVFVSAEESQVVDVIDVEARKLAGSIRVGKRPRGIGFTPDGLRAYVACEIANTVYAIDVPNRKVLAAIPAGGRSNGIKVHPTGREVYVSNGADGTVMVIDTTTNTVTQTIKVGNRPWNMALTADGGKLYVANGRSNTVSVIDTATKKEAEADQGGRATVGCADARRPLAFRSVTHLRLGAADSPAAQVAPRLPLALADSSQREVDATPTPLSRDARNLRSMRNTSVKHDRSAVVHDDLVLQVAPDGARKNDLFDIAPGTHQVLHRIAVGHPHHVLLDDRPRVQHLRHVMRGCTDHLHATGVRRVVGTRARKRGQECMVNIDDPVFVGTHKAVGDNLHVLRQHHQVDPVFGKQRQLRFLDFGLVVG